MSRFIKLTNKIINTAHISKISFYQNPNRYYIQMAYSESITNVFGMFFAGSGWVSGGGASSNEISICSENNSQDYKIIDEWYKNI